MIVALRSVYRQVNTTFVEQKIRRQQKNMSIDDHTPAPSVAKTDAQSPRGTDGEGPNCNGKSWEVLGRRGRGEVVTWETAAFRVGHAVLD